MNFAGAGMAISTNHAVTVNMANTVMNNQQVIALRTSAKNPRFLFHDSEKYFIQCYIGFEKQADNFIKMFERNEVSVFTYNPTKTVDFLTAAIMLGMDLRKYNNTFFPNTEMTFLMDLSVLRKDLLIDSFENDVKQELQGHINKEYSRIMSRGGLTRIFGKSDVKLIKSRLLRNGADARQMDEARRVHTSKNKQK